MATTGGALRPLDSNEVQSLVEAVGEAPETAIPIHLLERGTCKAYAVGAPESLDAVVIQSDTLREEPCGLGDNAQGLWDLLRHLDHWWAVDVSQAVAPRLGALIRDGTEKRVCYYGDVYHTLTKPAPIIGDPVVRELTTDDIGLLETADAWMAQDFGGLSALLDEGFVAAAVVDGQIVGSASDDGALTDPLRRYWCRLRTSSGAGAGLPQRQPRFVARDGCRRRVESQSGVAVKTTWRRCGSPRNWDSRRSPGVLT